MVSKSAGEHPKRVKNALPVNDMFHPDNWRKCALFANGSRKGCIHQPDNLLPSFQKATSPVYKMVNEDVAVNQLLMKL